MEIVARECDDRPRGHLDGNSGIVAGVANQVIRPLFPIVIVDRVARAAPGVREQVDRVPFSSLTSSRGTQQLRYGRCEVFGSPDFT